jgi:hypothetical protein
MQPDKCKHFPHRVAWHQCTCLTAAANVAGSRLHFHDIPPPAASNARLQADTLRFFQ